MKLHLDQDDVVIAVGLGLVAGAASVLSIALSVLLVGVFYVALAVVLGK